jgi:hypothetical protein
MFIEKKEKRNQEQNLNSIDIYEIHKRRGNHKKRLRQWSFLLEENQENMITEIREGKYKRSGNKCCSH